MSQADSERAALGCAILIALAMVCTGIGGIFGYPWGFICFGAVALWRLLSVRAASRAR